MFVNGPGHAPLQKIAPYPGGPGPHRIHGSSDPPESTSQTARRLVQPLAHLMIMSNRHIDHEISIAMGLIFALRLCDLA